MSGKYGVGSRISGPSASGTPVVSVRPPALEIKEIHFATTRAGSTRFHYLYNNSNTHSQLSGKNLQWWARGAKITVPEWVRGRSENENYRACFVRNAPISMSVKLVATPVGLAPLMGTLAVTPTVDGSAAHLQPVSVSFHYPASAAEYWVNLTTGGAIPDEVGQYLLRLRWDITGAGFQFGGPRETRHKIYAAYAQPLQPGYDSASPADAGRAATRDQGTLTGTRKRLDHMMRLIGGADRRHPAGTQANLVDLYWQLHQGINDTPGAPPYFDAGHTEHLTVDGTRTGAPLPLEDQWLAWVPNSAHWNDASCIGHVQLAKTMLAAVGLFARRTWIFPHTTRLPNGTTRSFADTDLYCLGRYDSSRLQTWTFTHGAGTYRASPKLIEPDAGWENFEACLLSPTGKFLTGGYTTGSNPASFRTNKGFNSTAELLRWWCNTSRGSFRRFVCWAYHNEVTDEVYFWDVNGGHYTLANFEEIRRRGLTLPVP